MMDIRVYRMKAGETRSFKRDGEELAVLLLSGNITYAWDGNKETVSRKDVFTEGPWCVHVCTGTEVSVTAEADSEILVQCTKNDTEFAAKLYKPEDAPRRLPAEHLQHPPVPHMAGGKSSRQRETAGIRDVHTERKSRVLLIAHTT